MQVASLRVQSTTYGCGVDRFVAELPQDENIGMLQSQKYQLDLLQPCYSSLTQGTPAAQTAAATDFRGEHSIE
jgi:hypothetical protein